MTSDSKALRTALGAFATGVTIVTTRRVTGVDAGLTANSFSSVSLDPPMVLWSLSKTSSSIEIFREATHFAVHILAADQDALSGRFASKMADRFEGLVVERGHGEVPMLPDCSARFECRTAFQYEGGDHVIFVGEVLRFTHSDRAPLLFHGGRYGMLIRKEAAAVGETVPAGSALSPNDLAFHLSRAFHAVGHDVTAEWRRRGWSESEYACLSLLGRQDGQNLAELELAAHGHNWIVTREALASLAGRGLAEVGEDGRATLTHAGRQAIIEIIAIIKASEADALEGFDFSEVQLLKQLLRRLSRQG